MTTPYAKRGPEGEPSASPEKPPQKLSDLHASIGIYACYFATGVNLENLFNPNHKPETQEIIWQAYRNLIGEIDNEPLLKPVSGAFEDLDFYGKRLLADPVFEAGFGKMQAFLRALIPYIQRPPFQGAVRNTIPVGRIEFDRLWYKTSFEKDPRCLEIVSDARETLIKRYPPAEKGVIEGLGVSFAFFLFWAAAVDFTNSSLDKLIAAKSNKSL